MIQVSDFLRVRNTLFRLPLFSELGDEELDDLSRDTREVQPRKGEILFHQGETPTGLFVLIDGRVSLKFPSQHGTEKVLAIVNPGETFGEAVLFLQKPYPVFAEAVVDSRAMVVMANALNQAISRNAGLARKMLAGLSKRLHELVEDVETYSMKSSAQRVICMLQHHAPQEAMGSYEFTLPAPKNVIASRLNLTPETFSRILHSLSEEGLIRVTGRSIAVLNSNALHQYS